MVESAAPRNTPNQAVLMMRASFMKDMSLTMIVLSSSSVAPFGEEDLGIGLLSGWSKKRRRLCDGGTGLFVEIFGAFLLIDSHCTLSCFSFVFSIGLFQVERLNCVYMTEEMGGT